jgi:hypothetical protein
MIWFDQALLAQGEKGVCGWQAGMQPEFHAELVTRFMIIVLSHERGAQGHMIPLSGGINGDRVPEKLHGFGQAAGAITDHSQVKIFPRRRRV